MYVCCQLSQKNYKMYLIIRKLNTSCERVSNCEMLLYLSECVCPLSLQVKFVVFRILCNLVSTSYVLRLRRDRSLHNDYWTFFFVNVWLMFAADGFLFPDVALNSCLCRRQNSVKPTFSFLPTLRRNLH